MLNLVQMAKIYQKTPSELLNIIDEYDAYCLNEAGLLYLDYLEQGKKPRWLQKSANDELKNGKKV